MNKKRKKEGQQTKNQGLLSILFPWCICSLFLKRSVQYITIYVFNFSFPLLFCGFFPIYGRKYSMKAKLFMENMWEFSLWFFAPYKVNIPMCAGEFFLCYFFVPYKANIPMYAGDLNKSNTRNIFVKCKWKFTFFFRPNLSEDLQQFSLWALGNEEE